MKMTTARLERLLSQAFGEGAKDRSPALMRAFLGFLKMLKQVEPLESHPDRIWTCPWIRTQGQRVDWHSCRVQIYEEKAHFFLKDRYTFAVDLKSGEFTGLHLFEQGRKKDTGYGLAEWLLAVLKDETKRFLLDPERYNRSVAKRLPCRYRLGKIRRELVWKHQAGKRFIKDELTRREVKEFLRAVRTCGQPASLREMWRDRFLEICSIAYDAIFSGDKVGSLAERYRLHADGRDDGLLKLPPRDIKAFEGWIREGSKGGHPWEIIRGGNSTHISLYCHYTDGNWVLYLDGHSAVCAARTAKIAIAAYRAQLLPPSALNLYHPPR